MITNPLWTKPRLQCRFYVVENPVRMKKIREYTYVGDDGKARKPFRYWPGGDGASTAVVNSQIRKWKLLCIARDRLWNKKRDCPQKLQDKITETENWLTYSGYMCMEDMPPEFNDVIDEMLKEEIEEHNKER